MSLALGPPLGDNSPQNVAIGLKTDPVAFGTAAGAAVIRNSQRCRRFASRPIDSRSQLSKIGMPIENVRRYQIKRRVRSEGQEEQLRLACPFIEMGRRVAVSPPIVANSGAEGGERWSQRSGRHSARVEL